MFEWTYNWPNIGDFTIVAPTKWRADSSAAYHVKCLRPNAHRVNCWPRLVSVNPDPYVPQVNRAPELAAPDAGCDIWTRGHLPILDSHFYQWWLSRADLRKAGRLELLREYKTQCDYEGLIVRDWVNVRLVLDYIGFDQNRTH